MTAVLVELHRQTGFVFADNGRMIHERAPDQSRGSRFRLAGCREANVVVIREDVPESAARELEHLARDEPPLFSAESIPIHLSEYVEVLADDRTPDHRLGLAWTVPRNTGYLPGASLV